MNLRLVTLIIALAAFAERVPGAGATEVANKPDFLAIAPFIEQVLVETKSPSLAIAVSRHGKVIWEQGFGWPEPKLHIPANAHTLYGLASVTKAITATELMVLSHRRQIDLDKPVNHYLGAAKISSARWSVDAATVRRIATHTAGLTSFDAICYDDELDCDRSLEHMIARYGIAFWRPGERFDYSNLGYGVLSQLIAHATGRSYFEAVLRDVLAPLGMIECAVDRSAIVAPHYDSGSRAPGQEALAQGASSLACSADALLRLGMFELKDHRAVPPLLSDAEIDSIQERSVQADDGLRYDLGWWIDEHHHGYRLVYASGGTADSGALLYTFPTEDIAIVVIGNGGNPRQSDVADRVAALLLPSYAADLATGAMQAVSAEAAVSAALDSGFAALVGTWNGTIQTWAGPRAAIFVIDRTGMVKARIADAPFRTERPARRLGQGFVLGAHGIIGTPETERRRPYRIGFELYPDGADTLRGAATTWQDPGARNGGVFPFAVQLRRQAASLGGNTE